MSEMITDLSDKELDAVAAGVVNWGAIFQKNVAGQNSTNVSFNVLTLASGNQQTQQGVLQNNSVG